MNDVSSFFTRSIVRVTRSSARMICKRVRSTASLTVASKRFYLGADGRGSGEQVIGDRFHLGTRVDTIACVDSRIGAVFI